MAQKKSFKTELNPVMQFISKPEEPKQPEHEAQERSTPPGYKVNPYYIETKSKRIQLLLQPSLHEKLKKKAAEEGISVNELIHSTLEEATREGK